MRSDYTLAVHCLGAAGPPAGLAEFPKAARLDELRRAQFPVPCAWVLLPLKDQLAPAADPLAPQLLGLGPGPWILRMCLAEEDGETRSGAGLGLSLGDLTEAHDIERAWARLHEHAKQLRGEGWGRWALLAQEQRASTHLAVCLHSRTCPGYVEIHKDPGLCSLEDGRSPSYGGPAKHWQHHSAAQLNQSIDELATKLGFDLGLDAELVLDASGWWIVQARPLVRELFGAWPRFESMLDPGTELEGTWVLDAEHNPAPLSHAHRWLLDRLRQARPGQAGEPTALNGWLYLRTPLRKPKPKLADDALEEPRDTLRRLISLLLPDLRARVLKFETSLEAQAQGIADALTSAEAIFLMMVDTYTSQLMPARKRAESAAQHMAPGPQRGATTLAASLSGKAQHLSALPIEWDIASESLADRLSAAGEPTLCEAIPKVDELDLGQLPVFLGEWDDHFFAWGLRPLRAAYLSIAKWLSIDPKALFELSGDELCALEAGSITREELLVQSGIRAQRRRHEAALQAPARIIDGKPYPDQAERRYARGRGMFGLGIGPPFSGVVAFRASLGELIDRPAKANEVLCLPALTAPAAWVLQRLGVRAVCTQHGGAGSHGSLMARELGLSAIIGCPGLLELREGERVELDTQRGHIRRTS